jgi:hypothetical protein
MNGEQFNETIRVVKKFGNGCGRWGHGQRVLAQGERLALP